MFCKKPLATLVACVSFATAAMTIGPAEAMPAQGGDEGDPESPEDHALPDVPDAQPDELIVTSRADANGYHLQIAEEANNWAWRPLATILPEGAQGEPWTGYHCLTGDARFVVAVVAPRHASNDPAARDRGGLLYRVELPHGEVTPLAANAATKYYNPGCGADSTAAVITHEGTDQQETTVRLYDVAEAEVIDQWSAEGQLTSAVPAGDGTVAAARDHALVELDRDGEHVIAEPGGLPFQVRANQGGGVDFLVTDRGADDLEIWSASVEEGADELVATEVGSGALGETKLFAGGEQTVVVNATEVDDTSRFSEARADGGTAFAASSHGAVVAVDLPDGSDRIAVDDDRHREYGIQDASARSLQRANDGADLSRSEPRVPAGVGTAELPDGLEVVPEGDIGAFGHSNPKCAVTRNNVLRQAHQPSSEQIDWAIQQATRNNLKGSVLTRPAYHNMWWLPEFEPSVQFPRRALAGAGSSSVPVPPSVAQAVFAQESNWKQASWRALPNVAANPLVGDYYGAKGTLDLIDYENADCGYGISQVTTPMSADSDVYTDLQKDIAAVDYTSNVAAGLDFLVRHWNEAHDEDVYPHTGDPSKLENWYFALWAYNSGFYPEGGDHAGTPYGAWGLGWTNNPIQADYPPDRNGFLRDTYADAEHPNDWPYQERIFGWMETPQLNYRGETQYTPPETADGTGLLSIPDRTFFCDESNSCDPEHEAGDTSYCTLRPDGPYCWWHQPASWENGELATSVFTVDSSASEPAIASGSDDDNYPPNCNDLPPLSQDGRPHVIVDNAHPNLNVPGCSPSGWSSKGTFTVDHGANTHGAPLGEIDWHQLGTGFSGHTWFTKNRPSGDSAHINVGTWTPPTLDGRYNVKAHIPPSGASTSSAHYVVHDGAGNTSDVYIDQHLHENRWVSLGNFDLQSGARVTLTNVTDDSVPGTANVAYDAMGFTPIPDDGEVVDVAVDGALIFDPDQSTTVDPSSSWFVNNPMVDDDDLKEWALDHVDPLVDLPICDDGQDPDTNCLPVTVWFISAVFRNQVESQNPARWQAFPNPRPPAELPDGYLSDPDNHKHHNRMQISYRISSSGSIDPASVATNFQSQAGDTHIPPVMVGLFEQIDNEYGISAPDLRYNEENMSTYSHGSTAVDPLAAGGAMPGRAFRPHVTEAEIVEGSIGNECVELNGIGGGMIAWKPALNEGGIAGEVERWKDDIKDARDAGDLPPALYELADGFYHYWWSNQYGTHGYEGSPFRSAPPIWLEMGIKVCGETGQIERSGANGIAMNSQMPDVYLWRNGQSINNVGTPQGEAAPVLEGDFIRFSWVQSFDDDSAWGQCSYSGASTYEEARGGNPWAVDMLIDGKDLGNNVTFCRNDLPDPSDH